MKNDKPIAVLASIVSDGFKYLRENYDLRIINWSQQRAVDVSGQEYIIITDGKHVRGYEFSAMIETEEFAIFNPDRDYLREAVQMRIR